MTIDEAIQHCKEQVQEQAKKGCYSCAEEHQQLAEWLKELKAYREQDSVAISNLAMRHILNHEVKWINERMTREEAIYELEHMKTWSKELSDEEIEAIVIALKALSRSENPNTCGDAISRQAVLDVTWEEPSYTDALNVLTEVRDKVKALPSVTPQQKTGRWIDSHIPESILCECSECGFTCGAYSFNYCPNCGAKMEVEDAD